MRVIRYLKDAKAAVALIVVLLLVQACAELSLPHYTSDLVDVGIQQGGIDHASPEAMRASTYAAALVLASPDEATLIARSYEEADDGSYVLTDEGDQNREALDAAMAWPMAAVSFAQRDADGERTIEGGFDLDGLVGAIQSGQTPEGDVHSAVESVRDGLSGVDDALIEQQAMQAVRAEYEALGMNLGAIQMGSLIGIGVRMVAMTALMGAASIAVGYLASRTAAKVARSLRERLFCKVLSFSDAEIQRFSTASLITRGTNDIQQIQMVLAMGLRMVLYAPVLAIGGIVMVSQTNVAMSWIIVLAVAAMFVLIGILMAVAMPKFKAMQKMIDRVNLVAREILTGVPVIRAFGRQDFEEARFDEASTALYRTQLFTNRAMALMMPTMMLIMNAVSVLIVWVGGGYIDAGVIQTGDMIAFITYSMVIIMSFLIIGMMAIMLPRADVAAERVNEVLSTSGSILDPSHPVALPLSSCSTPAEDGRVAALGARIEFRDVSFSFDAGSAPVLRHIDFVVEPGRTLAIVGPTGSGKSTVLKLIERFYDATDGAVLIDGVDVRDVPQHDLRSQLGYVPQKAFLFSGSIADTVRFGVPDATDSDVRRAASVAQASDFIDAKDDGFDSFVAQGGDNLSGGQRQRLSIARAVALGARAYLFDDSFSALDYATDARVRRALSRELAGATKVIVAQRVSTVLNADAIAVLDDGAMVGYGTHEQLLRTCPAYQEIARSQLSASEIERTLLGDASGEARASDGTEEEGTHGPAGEGDEAVERGEAR